MNLGWARPLFREQVDRIRSRRWVIRDLASSAWTACPGILIGLLVQNVSLAVLPVAMMLATGVLIGSIPGLVAQGAADASLATVLAPMLPLAVVVLVQQVASAGGLLLSEELARSLDLHYRERLMKLTLAPVGVLHLEDESIRDRVSVGRRLGVDVGTASGAIIGYLGLASWRLSALGSLLLLAGFKWWLALEMIVLLPIVKQLAGRDVIRTAKVRSGRVPSIRRANYFRDLAFDPAGAKEVKLFGLGDWLREMFTHGWWTAMTDVWKERRSSAPARVAVSVLVLVAYGVPYVMLARAGIARELSLGQLTVLVQAVLGAAAIGSAMPHVTWRIEHGVVAIEGLLAAEAQTSTLPADVPSTSTEPGMAPPGPIPVGGDICFEGVTFRYPRGPEDVLKELTLQIPAGRSVAIVGANGAGKTTLTKLLCRLYEPDSGAITFDGTDISQLPAPTWRRMLSVVFQDFARYEVSLRDNVAFGSGGEVDGDELIWQSLDAAGIGDFARTLPRQLDTPLSVQLRGGVEPSGGQWQRLALARALYAARKGAGILILDEPTSSLDVRAEAEIFNRFFAEAEGLTRIVISHRFPTVRRAEHIVVLRGHAVLEQGSHEELMAGRGEYFRLFSLQAARFIGSPDSVATETGS